MEISVVGAHCWEGPVHSEEPFSQGLPDSTKQPFPQPLTAIFPSRVFNEANQILTLSTRLSYAQSKQLNKAMDPRWARWHIPLILVLRRQRGRQSSVKGQPGLHTEL